MVVLVTCKNEEYLIKNESARVQKSIYVDFSDAQWQLTSQSVVESHQNSNSTERLWLLLTCKNEEDPIKIEGARVLKTFLPFCHWDFFRRSRATYSAICCSIGLKFKLVRDFMVVLLICKNEEDPIKNEGARLLTRLCIAFSDAR